LKIHPPARRVSTATLLLAAAVLAVSPAPGTAVSEVRLAIGDIYGGTWSARDVTVRVAFAADSSTVAEVSASRMTLPAGLGSLERVTLKCPQPLVRAPEFSCRNARVTGRFGRLGTQSFSVDAKYDRARGWLEFSVAGVRLGAATVGMRGSWRSTGWSMHAESTPMALATAQELAAPWFKLPEGFQAEGRAALRVDASGGGNALHRLSFTGMFADVTANNAGGTVATDKLTFDVTADLSANGPDWNLQSTVEAASGQAYVEPLFLDVAAFPLSTKLRGRWRSEPRTLEVEHVDFNLKAVARGSARGALDFARAPLLRSLTLQLDELTFPGAYASLLQPFLLSTELKELDTSGTVHGAVEIENGAPAAINLLISGLSARDKGGKLGMQDLKGRVIWRSGTSRSPIGGSEAVPEPESELEWLSASLYGMRGGAARLHFVAAGANFRLLEPTLLPIFDGGLAINTLAVREFGSPDMSLRFDARLEPISMGLLSKAFGWPTFGGTIEGRIPNVTLAERVLSFGGDLEANVFGGRVVVGGMRLRDPLGTYPRLSADITMRNLDLEAVTGTFSFGTITGRLDADVRGLELFRWRPTRFDARLYTPRSDDSRHQISQRAVSNLSNIGGGGGVAAALQGGVLRFFQNFGYSRLGLSCRLENEVCFMNGVEPVGKGDAYYIVKGSGIPRIDIIGNAHRVNWNRLVAQLQAMQRSGGPVVK
jgi:hypothetical protein